MQWIYPILLAGRADLQSQYSYSRNKGSNYAVLPRGCNNCTIPGEKLNLPQQECNYELQCYLENDNIISKAISKLKDGESIKDATEAVDDASLYCIPVYT